MTSTEKDRVIFNIPNDGWISKIHCDVDKNLIVTYGYPNIGQAKKIQVWSTSPELGEKTIHGTTNDLFTESALRFSTIKLFMKKNTFVVVLVRSPWSDSKHDLEHHYRVFQLLPPHSLVQETKFYIYKGQRGWSSCRLMNLPEEDLMFYNESDDIIKVFSISETRVVKRFKGLHSERSYIEAVEFSGVRNGEVYYIDQCSISKPNPQSQTKYGSATFRVFHLSKFNYKNPEKCDPSKSSIVSEVMVTRNTSRFFRLDLLQIHGEEKLLLFFETKNVGHQVSLGDIRKERFHWEIYDCDTMEKERDILFDDPHIHCLSNRFIFFGDGILYDFQRDLFHDLGDDTSLIRCEEIQAPLETYIVQKHHNHQKKKREIKYYLADIFVKNGRFVAVHGYLNWQTSETGIYVSEIVGSEEIIGMESKDYLERAEFVKSLLLDNDGDRNKNEQVLTKEVCVFGVVVGNEKCMVFKSLML